MSTVIHPKASKEQFWRQTIQLWRQSGLSVRAFCQRRGLAAANFYAWRRTLNRRDAQTVNFIPVKVTPSIAADDDNASTGLELVLDNRRRLRIGPGFDTDSLRRLLAVLDED